MFPLMRAGFPLIFTKTWPWSNVSANGRSKFHRLSSTRHNSSLPRKLATSRPSVLKSTARSQVDTERHPPLFLCSGLLITRICTITNFTFHSLPKIPPGYVRLQVLVLRWKSFSHWTSLDHSQAIVEASQFCWFLSLGFECSPAGLHP